MSLAIRLLESKFPEHWFSQMQRQTFAGVESESPELAAMLIQEEKWARQQPNSPPSSTPMVRFGAYEDAQLVGWSCGWFERSAVYYMANSGVLPAFRRRGIYSALLDAVQAHAMTYGVQIIRSQHSVLNNAIIICKLKRGFQITGLSMSAQMGSLVELSLHLSWPRGKLFSARVIPLVTPP